MSKKQTETTGIDLLWNGWLDGVKKVNELQNEFEVESFKVLNTLEDLLNTTNEVLKKAEKESSVFSKEMNELTKGNESLHAYWLNQVEAVNNHMHHLLWNSQKRLSDFVLRSQKQISSNTESVLKERQKIRSEIVKTIEELVEKIQETQKAFVPTR